MAKRSQETAFVLSEKSAADAGYTGVGPFHFAGFPGCWTIGQPIGSDALGFATVTDAAARIDELGLPLTRTLVDEGSAPMPVVAGHIPSQAQADASGWKAGPGDAGCELAEGESFPPARPAEVDVSPDFSAIAPAAVDEPPAETAAPAEPPAPDPAPAPAGGDA